MKIVVFLLVATVVGVVVMVIGAGGPDVAAVGRQVDTFLRSGDVTERAAITGYIGHNGGVGTTLEPLTRQGRIDVAHALCGYLDARQWDDDLYIIDDIGDEIELC